MKIYSFRLHFTIFLIVFFFFILPPCFTFSVSSNFLNWSFPVINCAYAAAALLIFYLFNSDKKKSFVVFPFIISLCGLLCFSFIFKGIAVFIQNSSISESTFFFGKSNLDVVRPESFITWFFCILTFLFSAFFEEVIYRFFLPFSLNTFLEKKWNGKIIILITEVVTALLFAAAHIYLGFLAVLNALCGHIILRICYKKYGLIIPVFLSHFAYNIISLILL